MPSLYQEEPSANEFDALLDAALHKARAARRAAERATSETERAGPEGDEFARRLAAAASKPAPRASRASRGDGGSASAPVRTPGGTATLPRGAQAFDCEERMPADAAREVSCGTGPCGAGGYVVRQGECMNSIALEHGFFWESLWNEAGNSDLKSTRRDPNVLLPGDCVFIPEKRRKEEPGQTEMRHRFIRKGEPALLRLTFLKSDETPRAGEHYRLEIDGTPSTGELSADGTLERRIPGNARRAVVRFGAGPFEERFDIWLGALDPSSEPSGVRARLVNLGYLSARSSDERTVPVAALAEFQARQALPRSGELDETTRESLELADHSR